ncbi:unnamed protein product [Phytomonas sp. Hart1]|nr:unnamed protein product [Phytomonas sp. Hart1]|eukprot:CCW67795.1 unnamed protein product [Phytomonas sp. isolate Hart1]
MSYFRTDNWWKRRDHRRIRGARGQRFLSLRMHILFIVSVLSFLEFYMIRSTDIEPYHIAPPPVRPPPPLARSLGYSLTSEMPYLQTLELEDRIPDHVPQKYSFNYAGVRSGGKMS